MTTEDRDPVLGNMTRRYLDAQNKVAERTALLTRTLTLLHNLRQSNCGHFTLSREKLLADILEVLK